MANKFILIIQGSQVVRKDIRQPPSPRRTLRAWVERCRDTALANRVRHYIFRFGGKWHVFSVYDPGPIRSFASSGGDGQAAAEMYLLHRFHKV